MSDDDRRARRSRRALSQALMGLMQDHDWGDISVQMICASADVARSTFYAHYPTKQDLLDESFAGVETQLAALSEEGGLVATLDWLVAHLATAAGFHRRLQGSTAGLVIMLRFRRLMRERIARDLGAEGEAPAPRELDFALGGIFGLLEAWLGTGCREAPGVIGADLLRLVRQTAGRA